MDVDRAEIDGPRSRAGFPVLRMYELQFWLGLREFATHRCGPSLVLRQQAEEFESRLSKSAAPTSQAQSIKAGLLKWLVECRKRNWLAFDANNRDR